MSFPARLHALLAREARTGVVWRRGPAGSVCSIGWDRDRDQFRIGQWLRGRIYERRSDLSPDGRHLIYFARGSSVRHRETKGTWTAVSRAPWLKAEVLWGKGDCWQGGGLFTSNRKYWLNGCHFPVRESRSVAVDERYRPSGGSGAECLGIYFPRLERDGWRRIFSTIFERDLPGGWTLRKYAFADLPRVPGRGCYWDEHELVRGSQCIDGKRWEWADRDLDSVVWAEGGRLWRAGLSDSGLDNPRMIQDFNAMSFEARVAPY